MITLLSRSFNILSLLHGHIYFPTHSNSLKTVGSYLGCTWTDQDASGLKSIALRSRWEKARGKSLKQELVRYNMEDCLALKRVAELVLLISEKAAGENNLPNTDLGGCMIAGAEEINYSISRKEYCKQKFALPDLAIINNCAYFDYQRERVFLRTNDTIRKAQNRKKRSEKSRKLNINRTIQVRNHRCPDCFGTAIRRDENKIHTKLLYDLRISDAGVSRQVISCSAMLHYCLECKKRFRPERYKRASRHFHSLKCWAMYQHVVHRLSCQQIEKSFRDTFNLDIPFREIHAFKHLLSIYYRRTYNQIITSILGGDLIHCR